MIEWACNRYSVSLKRLRKEFAYATIAVLFDAYWWFNIAPTLTKPKTEEAPAPGTPQKTVIDATQMSADQILNSINKIE